MTCTNRLSLIFVFVSFAFVTAQAADQYADSFTHTIKGDKTDGSGSPTGAPDGNALSLGHNGQVVVTFSDNRIFDKTGNDFKITDLGPNLENYTVEASNDGGASWVMIGNGTGTQSFDLNGSINSVNALRITDVNSTDDSPNGGLDVDSITVFYPWDLEIDQVDSAYLPQNGNKAHMTARIVPAAPGIIRFYYNLADVSDESGDAMNHGTQAGDDKDFKFEAQSGFTVVQVPKSIETASEVDHATVDLSCFDYGAYGKIRAEIRQVSGVARGVSERPILIGHLTGSDTVMTINVPRDDDGNNIADSWTGNSGGADDDADATPTGNGVAGDRLTRYEEYRGFFVNGSHLRTNPDVKDVFIHDDGGINQTGDFTNANLDGASVHWINDGEFLSNTSRSINFQWSSHHIDTQRCILLLNNIPISSRHFFWGEATLNPPYATPSNYLCAVYTDSQAAGGGITSGTTLWGDITSTSPNIVLIQNIPDPAWEPSGKFQIDAEIIAYSSVSMPSAGHYEFTGLTRGADGTAAAAHSNAATANYFSDQSSAITWVVGHEPGHSLNINHDTSTLSQMTGFVKAGANMADPARHTFRRTGASAGSLQEFKVK
jgi:hypothetical protein